MCVGTADTYRQAVERTADEVRELAADNGVALNDVLNELGTATITAKDF